MTASKIMDIPGLILSMLIKRYSSLDDAADPAEIVEYARELGMPLQPGDEASLPSIFRLEKVSLLISVLLNKLLQDPCPKDFAADETHWLNRMMPSASAFEQSILKELITRAESAL